MTNTTTKKIFVVLLMPLMLLSLVACGVKPVQEDVEINPPSVEDNVEDQRDEITGDNMTGVGVTDEDKNDIGVVTPNPDAAKDENPNAQQPEQDTPPVDGDQDKDTETSKPDDTNKDENTTPPKQEDTTPPATTPDDDDDEDVTPPSSSGSTGGNNTPSSDTADYNGSTIRAFPNGTDVNSLTPQKPGEKVYIGDVVYQWTGEIWGVKDTSTPPNQSSEINGDPFSGSQGMH